MDLDLDAWVIDTYGAIFNREVFLGQFNMLARHFGAPYSALHFEGPHKSKLGFTTGTNLARISEEYPEYRNLWVERGAKQLFQYGITHDRWHTPLKEIQATDYHRHLLKPLDIDHSIGVLCDSKGDGSFAMLSLSRSQSKGHFDQDTVQQLKYLQPHLQGIIQLYEQAYTLERRVHSLESLIENTPQCLIQIDQNLKLKAATDAAKKELEKAELCQVTAGNVFCLTNPSSNRVVKSLMKERNLGVKVIDISSCQSNAVLRIQELPQDSTGKWHPRKQFLLSLKRLIAEPANVSLETLHALFKLTPREAALALSMAQQLCLKNAADSLGIGHQTARTHLKSCFRKTNTHSQIEFVVLIREVLSC